MCTALSHHVPCILGFRSEEEIARLPGARRIDSSKRIYPGPGVDMYAFYRETVQRNLYRIPIQ